MASRPMTDRHHDGDGKEAELRIHGISRRRLGTDGHGVTDLVAMAGCPLSCKWCLNKGLLSSAPTKEVSAEELLADVMQETCYFVATEGGVTFGGGEPMLQWREIAAFAEIKPDWMNLSVETSLQAPPETVAELVPATNFWLVDIKTLDASVYEDYAKGSIGGVLENLGLLLPVADRVRIRVPVIPGYKGRDVAEQEAGRIRRMGFSDIEVFDYIVRDGMRRTSVSDKSL